MLENNRANINYVYKWQIEVEDHLRDKANKTNSAFVVDIKEYLDSSQKKSRTWHRNKLLTSLYQAAYFFYLDNYEIEVTKDQLKQLVDLFKQYISNYKKIYNSTLTSRNKKGFFGKDRGAQEFVDKPKLFWRYQEISYLELSSFARRL